MILKVIINVGGEGVRQRIYLEKTCLGETKWPLESVHL